MAFDGDCHSMAQRALELESTAPLVEHDPAECEMCADYRKEFYEFARTALPRLAEAYLELSTRRCEGDFSRTCRRKISGFRGSSKLARPT